MSTRENIRLIARAPYRLYPNWYFVLPQIFLAVIYGQITSHRQIGTPSHHQGYLVSFSTVSDSLLILSGGFAKDIFQFQIKHFSLIKAINNLTH